MCVCVHSVCACLCTGLIPHITPTTVVMSALQTQVESRQSAPATHTVPFEESHVVPLPSPSKQRKQVAKILNPLKVKINLYFVFSHNLSRSITGLQ